MGIWIISKFLLLQIVLQLTSLYFLCTYVSILGDNPPEMELLVQMVYAFRILISSPKITSKMFAPFYTLTLMTRSACFPTCSTLYPVTDLLN